MADRNRRSARGRSIVPAAVAVVALLVDASGSMGGPRGDERLARLDREIERLSVERSRLSAQGEGVLARLEVLSAEARLLDARLERARLTEDSARAGLAEVELELLRVSEGVREARARLGGTVRFLQMLGPGAGVRLMYESRRARGLAGALRAAQEVGGRFRAELSSLERLMGELDGARSLERLRLAEVEAARQEVARTRDALAEAIANRESALATLARKGEARDAAIAELERARGDLARRIAEGIASASESSDLDVSKFRGLLPLPAPGGVRVPFGPRRDPRLGTVMPHPGWDIDAPFGTHVKAPFPGRVAWSGWLRGYGLVAVLDHGRSVHTVYAHLSALLVDEGQTVAAGQVIASVGDTGSLEGARLYVEVREGGKAVDPALWFDRERGGT